MLHARHAAHAEDGADEEELVYYDGGRYGHDLQSLYSVDGPCGAVT